MFLSVAPATAAYARAPAPQTAPSTSRPATPLPKAWILVDNDTGAVISSGNEREALSPASLSKVLTALVAVRALHPTDSIPVSARAEATPATKINMKAGQVWTFDDTLHALLMSSANDAAVALAERVAGSVEAFQPDLDDEARRLGMQDAPVLLDPSGLDDSFSVGGGNRISARDLALAGRAVLAQPELAAIVGENIARFTGGDGIAHRLLNHNRLLRTYPGAIGMKTGWTKKAGHCLIAAAQRDGRTMLTVVLGAVDDYGSSVNLLDRGFDTPVVAETGLPHLPAVPVDNQGAVARPLPSPVPGATAAVIPHVGKAGGRLLTNPFVDVLAVLLGTVVLLRARVRYLRRRRRMLQRQRHRQAKPDKRAPAPPQPAPPAPPPPPAPPDPAVPLWGGRTLDEWERPLVSQR